MAPAETVAVSLVYCAGPSQVDEVQLNLPVGTPLSQALQLSGLLQRHGLDLQHIQAGIWGRNQALDVVLRERDRVEVYRPLLVDPKEARRLRYGRHKAAAAARKARLPAAVPTAPAPPEGSA
jgi:uncharacterized protein